MSVLILIILLSVLIFVHELGHFIVAKKNGIRVDEFAIGFPPTIFSKKKGGTKYSLNLIPFGGFVKIFGENIDEESLDPSSKDSFLNKSPLAQGAVLVAGVGFNIIFAWILISISFMAGFPSVVSESNISQIENSNVVISNLFKGSPADIAGLQSGDKIIKIENNGVVLEKTQTQNIIIHDIQSLVAQSSGEISVTIGRGGDNISNFKEILEFSIKPKQGIVDKEVVAIGISMENVGQMKLGFFKAIGRGFIMTCQLLKDIASGLVKLISGTISGNGSLSNVAGPVGIISLVGDAANFGFFYFLSFAAYISLNLAVLNILPLPALDGGRLLILIIESISHKKIKPKIVNAINGIGFLVLIILMIAITINDVLRLF